MHENKSRLNCWEYKNCGREPGGHNSQLGECVAASFEELNGINGGLNGGRSCWVLAETCCNNQIQGKYLEKIYICTACSFYKTVRNEEGECYTSSLKINQHIQDISENLVHGNVSAKPDVLNFIKTDFSFRINENSDWIFFLILVLTVFSLLFVFYLLSR